MPTSNRLLLSRTWQYDYKKILTIFGEYHEGTIYLDLEKVELKKVSSKHFRTDFSEFQNAQIESLSPQ